MMERPPANWNFDTYQMPWLIRALMQNQMFLYRTNKIMYMKLFGTNVGALQMSNILNYEKKFSNIFISQRLLVDKKYTRTIYINLNKYLSSWSKVQQLLQNNEVENNICFILIYSRLNEINSKIKFLDKLASASSIINW